MTITIDDIRAELTERTEAAEKHLAWTESQKAKAADWLELCRAVLDAHDRAVAAMLDRPLAPAVAPAVVPEVAPVTEFVAAAELVTESVKQKPRKRPIRTPRLSGVPSDERRQKIVAAYNSGTPTQTLALMYQISSPRVLQILREHEEKTGEKIERHWQPVARGRSAESAEGALPAAAAGQ